MARRALWITLVTLSGLVFFLSSDVTAARAQDGPGFDVARFVVCEGVSDREPVGVTNTFQAETEKAYAFLEARNIEANGEVDFVWIHEGVELDRIRLKLGAGPRWRTYSAKSLHGRVGNWRVELQGMDGKVITSADFKVE